MPDLISSEDKLKVISHSTKWPEGVADLISYEDKLKFNKVLRGMGISDTLHKEFDGNISLNIMVKGVPDLVPYEDTLKVISHST